MIHGGGVVSRSMELNNLSILLLYVCVCMMRMFGTLFDGLT